jgi:hypothetical protein
LEGTRHLPWAWVKLLGVEKGLSSVMTRNAYDLLLADVEAEVAGPGCGLAVPEEAISVLVVPPGAQDGQIGNAGNCRGSGAEGRPPSKLGDKKHGGGQDKDPKARRPVLGSQDGLNDASHL